MVATEHLRDPTAYILQLTDGKIQKADIQSLWHLCCSLLSYKRVFAKFTQNCYLICALCRSVLDRMSITSVLTCLIQRSEDNVAADSISLTLLFLLDKTCHGTNFLIFQIFYSKLQQNQNSNNSVNHHQSHIYIYVVKHLLKVSQKFKVFRI